MHVCTSILPSFIETPSPGEAALLPRGCCGAGRFALKFGTAYRNMEHFAAGRCAESLHQFHPGIARIAQRSTIIVDDALRRSGRRFDR